MIRCMTLFLVLLLIAPAEGIQLNHSTEPTEHAPPGESRSGLDLIKLILDEHDQYAPPPARDRIVAAACALFSSFVAIMGLLSILTKSAQAQPKPAPFQPDGLSSGSHVRDTPFERQADC